MKLSRNLVITITVILVYWYVLRFDPVTAAAREFDLYPIEYDWDFLNKYNKTPLDKYYGMVAVFTDWCHSGVKIVKPRSECSFPFNEKIYIGKYIDICFNNEADGWIRYTVLGQTDGSQSLYEMLG